jgi:hypothetical protein
MRKALLLVGSCVALAMLLTVIISTQPWLGPRTTCKNGGPMIATGRSR